MQNFLVLFQKEHSFWTFRPSNLMPAGEGTTAMPRPVIITCAVTGGAPLTGKHPAIPVTPAQIATAAIDAGKAGAAIAHIHVRDPNTGHASADLALYREVMDRIADSGLDIIVNPTTGEGGILPLESSPADRFASPTPSLLRPEARVAHIEALQPELCTLDMGTMNFGDNLFFNTPRDIACIAAGIARAGTVPELEVFDTGHLRLALSMMERGEIPHKALFQFCLGVPWGAPATAEAMLMMRGMLPPGSIWAAFGIGASQFPMVMQSALLGGHVRVGLEDNIFLSRGVLAPDNAALVGKAVRMIELLGEAVATPAQARAIMHAGRPETGDVS
jgi:uncharacterized protein (DUF849 family)